MRETLSESILKEMRELTPSVLATTREQRPYTTFITWLIAVDPSTIRFALTSNSYSAENIKQNPYVSVEVFGNGFAVSISGPVELIQEKIQGIDFDVSVFEMKIEKVVNNLFPGATIKGKIPFEHTGDISKAEELDRIILKQLR